MMFMIPIHLTCGPNARLHWAVRAKRVNAERVATRMFAPKGWEWKQVVSAGQDKGWVITLTRAANRKVDGDNLQGLFKAVRDEVATMMGVDDGSDRITWKYAQTKAPKDFFGVYVEVESAP